MVCVEKSFQELTGKFLLFGRKHFQAAVPVLLAASGLLANAQSVPNSTGTISTVATPGFTLLLPSSVAVDQQNNLYISDSNSSRILKVNQQTGVTSVYAGSGLALVAGQPNGDGGPASSSVLSRPQGLALAANGDLYVAEQGVANDVRKITAATGIITTVASGLESPTGVAYNDADRVLYISASMGSLGIIARVDAGGNQLSDWFVSSLHPTALAYLNGYLYCADSSMGEVIKVPASNGNTYSIGSSGLSNPAGLALDPSGNVYISLSGNASQSVGGSVIMLNGSTGSTTTVTGSGVLGSAGDGGPATEAQFSDSVTGLAIGPDGSLYIVDAKNEAIRKVTFPVNTPAPTCKVISFSAGPNPIYTEGPYGITSILANATCPYEIRVGSPSGPLFATGNGFTSTLTGNWVSYGLQFYLQQAGNTTSAGTLAAPLTVYLQTGKPGLACIATAFTANPNPIITNSQYGQTTVTAVTNCSFDVRVGSPNGKLFKEGRGYAALTTGQWVSDGMLLYLQPHGDTNAADTLSTVKLVVQQPPSGCTVNEFSPSANPIVTTARLNQISVHADATCAYDVRAGGPSGGLMGSATGSSSFNTGDWVTNGMSFFLQKAGDASNAGTLATFTVNTKLPEQAVSSCTVSKFKATDNPIISSGGSGDTNIEVNATCAWDLRLNDSAGAVLASSSGVGSVTAHNVTNGTKFYLQPFRDTSYLDTLAILNATVAGQKPLGCTVLVFSVTPILSDNEFGTAIVSADATCPYEIRVGSPDGELFGAGSGFTWAQTGNWVQFGQRFYLQFAGDTTEWGTLATQSAIVIP
jgi:sugar lactone lactonase YvrE